MATDVDQLLTRWTTAGLIDHDTAARIRDFEGTHAPSARLRWPILVALTFGGLMIGSGVLLFVSAHWDTLSPAARFSLVLVMVAIFHVAGAAVAERFPAMSSTLHAIGTVALGAGIFLAGQIFNLDEHWPGGLMLWAIGAVIAWILLKHTPQFALAAFFVPAWLGSEWMVASGNLRDWTGVRVLACGVFLMALSYFTAPVAGRTDALRRTLVWLGGLALLPAAFSLAQASSWGSWGSNYRETTMTLKFVGWIVAIGLPLIVSYVFRRQATWPMLCAVLFALVLINLPTGSVDVSIYAWWALGAIGLVAWGVMDARRERIDMGAAVFAATVMAYYFSHVMDKLGRSVSLVGLGLLFLGGGWALERARRRLILRIREQS